MITIRTEMPGDAEGIRFVNICAFGGPAEADIVDRLRQTCQEYVSFVAIQDGSIMGHILFTPARIEMERRVMEGMGLAPMAVLPEQQRKGVGSQLVMAGFAKMADLRKPFVIVLGHPGYYPRFGFVPASRYGIVSEYENVPDEAFMILVLQEASFKEVTKGIARYRPEFADAM
jgi:putative acetyltransferase